MKMQVMLRAMLALAATGMAAQIATGIHLQDVRFKGNTRLDGVDLKKCASDLKSKVYVGTDWTDYFVGTVTTKCLLDKGYFKSAVTASTEQLPDKNNTHQFAVTFNIDAGPRYHLGRLFGEKSGFHSLMAVRGQGAVTPRLYWSSWADVMEADQIDIVAPAVLGHF